MCTICMVPYTLSNWLYGFGCQFAVCLVCGWYFAVMGNVPTLHQCPFTMLVFSFCPCVMSVMLGGLAGFCHELQPHSAPLCICRTALPLSHCLAFVTLPVGPGSALGPSASPASHTIVAPLVHYWGLVSSIIKFWVSESAAVLIILGTACQPG